MKQEESDCETKLQDGSEGATHFGAVLGFEFCETEENTSIIELRLRREHCNLSGTVHGGVIMSLADAAGFWAGAVRSGVKQRAATVSLNCQFMRAAKFPETTSLRAEGRVSRHAKSMYFSTISVYAYPSGDLITSGQGVFSLVPTP